MDERSFTVPNISCGHCAATIQRELGELEGVTSVEADAASKRVTVRWQDPATWEKIEALLVEIEFSPAS
jgi:copper chaperone